MMSCEAQALGAASPQRKGGGNEVVVEAKRQKCAVIFTGTRCICVSEDGFTLRALLEGAVLIPFVRVRAEALIPPCVLSQGITLGGQKELVDSAAVDSVGFLCAASSLELAAARKTTDLFMSGLL